MVTAISPERRSPGKSVTTRQLQGTGAAAACSEPGPGLRVQAPRRPAGPQVHMRMGVPSEAQQSNCSPLLYAKVHYKAV